MSESVKKIKIKTPVHRLQIFGALRLISGVLCLLSCVYCLSCSGSNVVRIRVGIDSMIDIKKYGSIAVMDFVDSKSNSVTDQGRDLTRMIRKQLANSEGFTVLDERAMYLTLDEEMDKDKIDDPAALMSICSQLGVGALIVGAFDFRQISQPVPYIVERYSPSTGKYAPETRTYVRSSYRFSLHAKVVDGKTGETVFDYAPRVEERPEYRGSWGLPLSGETGSGSISLRTIAARPITAFVLNLVPHYEYEPRILAR